MRKSLSPAMLRQLQHIARMKRQGRGGSSAASFWPGDQVELSPTNLALHRRGLVKFTVVATLTPDGEREVIKAQCGKPHIEPVD